ncbi:MAG: ABC transporter permease subunit [Alphaproteobacteria bacterium]|nr:ABC transporter permease subunit [Alphaproteobacteria bacterium]
MNSSQDFGKVAAQIFILGCIMLGLGPLALFVLSRGALGALQFDSSVWDVLWFTLKQASLSTVLSVIPGLLIARALARRDFAGHAWVLRLFAIPTALPAIVVILALAQIFGTKGPLGGVFSFYGLGGILLAHVFFNLPLAVRLFYEASENTAAENFRLAAQLSFSDWAVFRHVEWPVLRNVVPRVSALIFLLCAASFVIVLTLGGPEATTLEVAIYQSLRLDFDVGRALALGFLQIGLCFILVALSGQVMLKNFTPPPQHLVQKRFDGNHPLARLRDCGLIAAGVLFVAPPLLALLVAGIWQLEPSAQLFSALTFSFGIGAGSAVLALVLGWKIAQSHEILSQNLSLAALIVPPAVMATGWFILLQGTGDTAPVVLLTIIVLNSLMALPFVVAIFAPVFDRHLLWHDKLCQQLGMNGWQRLTKIDLPLMRRPLLQAGLLAFVLSLGDLTAITLLGNQGVVTLPSLIQSQMGHYRGEAAQGSALVLAIISLGLSAFAQKLGRGHVID